MGRRLYGQYMYSRVILTVRKNVASSHRPSIFQKLAKVESTQRLVASEAQESLCLTLRHRTVNPNVVAISCGCSDVSCLRSQSLVGKRRHPPVSARHFDVAVHQNPGLRVYICRCELDTQE